MNLETLARDVEELKRKVETMAVVVDADHEVLSTLDKIIVRGNGTPSLQEVVRALSKTLTEFLDEVKEEKKNKKDEANKLKWLILGIGIPALLGYAAQAVIFWVRVFPIIK